MDKPKLALINQINVLKNKVLSDDSFGHAQAGLL